MKTAMCQYSLRRRWKSEQWTADHFAAEVRALGVEGIDFHTRMLPETDEVAGTIRAAVDRHALALSGLSFSNNFNQTDRAALDREVEQVKAWIRLAAEAGAPVSRIFGGHLSAEQRRDPAARKTGRERILQGLAAVLDEAQRCGVILALENHGGLPCTAEEQVAVVEHFNSPWLKATIDVGNYMACGQEGHVATRIAARHAAYVHFKDFRKVPDVRAPWGWSIEPAVLGEGDVDLPACVAALREAGFDGFVALEYEAEPPDEVGVPASVRAMKHVLNETL